MIWNYNWTQSDLQLRYAIAFKSPIELFQKIIKFACH